MKSKWYYLWCGSSAFGALVGAVVHSLALVAWSLGFAIYYWYRAESKYVSELKQYAEENKNEQESTTDSDSEDGE